MPSNETGEKNLDQVCSLLATKSGTIDRVKNLQEILTNLDNNKKIPPFKLESNYPVDQIVYSKVFFCILYILAPKFISCTHLWSGCRVENTPTLSPAES